jgi:hypothetical protein
MFAPGFHPSGHDSPEWHRIIKINFRPMRGAQFARPGEEIGGEFQGRLRRPMAVVAPHGSEELADLLLIRDRWVMAHGRRRQLVARVWTVTNAAARLCVARPVPMA